MSKASMLSLLALGLVSYARADEVYLNPGETVTLAPYHETEVTCRQPASTLIDKFCTCKETDFLNQIYELSVNYIFSSQPQKTVLVWRGEGQTNCEKLMQGPDAHSACKK